MSDAPETTSPKRRAPPRGWLLWLVLRRRPALLLGGVVMVLLGGALAAVGVRATHAFLFGFDLGVLVFLGVLLPQFGRATPEQMRGKARDQDAGRWGILLCGVALSAVMLVALATELRAGHGGGWAVAVAVLSIALSWLFMNTLFALHYAHGYYGDYGQQHQGLDFPGLEQPDYWDFAYFAIGIGMTFQVADVQITSRYLRRVVLLHSVIAFFLNVFIIAVSVNIFASQVA
ncbi:DUF1345 domain-containing protein [Frateuria defendens]|uniref:DUF1345 domain-containing protein n=1 Tax=Frateuria defendens TaxID=2219559 RepID=UPI00066FE419|nr:DUF1345 domain-containing protein [Frateuria defendens]